MSRTVHHVRYNHRDSTREYEERLALYPHLRWGLRRMFSARESHVVFTLRYSAAAERRAEESGHRPRPEKLRRRLRAYTYPRTFGMGRIVSEPARRLQRALRAAERATERQIRAVLRAAPDPVEQAWDVDFPDPRHRHFGVWDAW